MRKVRKCNKFCKSTNLQIFWGLGEDDSWRYLKQKILWHCPFKAKHQRTQEYIDVTSQNFIKILSLETFPLKSNNSIYKITTPCYGVEEEICRRMPRKFFSSTQFQWKRKSLVFFQSINFLWCGICQSWDLQVRMEMTLVKTLQYLITVWINIK